MLQKITIFYLLSLIFISSSVWGKNDNCQIASSFDMPVGVPNSKGYYNAQPFGKNNHLGDDWNGTGGGNSDLGDPIYAIANGKITFSHNIAGGWGNVIKICHNIGTESQVSTTSTIRCLFTQFNQRFCLMLNKRQGNHANSFYLKTRWNRR